MDAWVMLKQWSSPCCIGYEIKVDRADFLRDEKWPGYLPLCNRFYFVAPPEVIRPEELPPEAGLLRVSNTGAKLYQKKKAPHRDVEIPENLFRYILMCRAKITPALIESDRLRVYREWLEEKTDTRKLGYAIRGRIGEVMRELHFENERLRGENAGFDQLRKILAEAKINNYHDWDKASRLQKAIQARLRDVVPPDFDRRLTELVATIGHVQGEWEKLAREETGVSDAEARATAG
jgi:hypothetical protein